MVAGPSWAPARVSRRDEIEGDAVQAVAEPGRRGTVLEHVAEMPAAAATMHLGPDQEQTMVLRGANAARERRPEARPTRAAVELGLRREERQIATGAEVVAGSVLLVERAAAGLFGVVLAQHAELRWRQQAPPLAFAPDDLERGAAGCIRGRPALALQRNRHRHRAESEST